MQPDYSKYSNFELLEAIDSIDKIKYPERYRKLALEIKSRSNEFDKDLRKAKQDNKDLWVAIGCLFFVMPLLTFIGIDAMVTGEFALKTYVFTREEYPVLFIAHVVFCFAIVLLLAVGLFKMSRSRT